MNDFKIDQADQSDYQEMIAVWEASVRATHHFLTEEDIVTYRKLILNEYFDLVKLYCVRSEDQIIGFMGIDGKFLQMLFVHPDFRGKEVGKQLLHFAITEKQVDKVDVNEQNLQAIGFYEKLGFKTFSRTESDAAGKPYPILSMELQTSIFDDLLTI